MFGKRPRAAPIEGAGQPNPIKNPPTNKNQYPPHIHTHNISHTAPINHQKHIQPTVILNICKDDRPFVEVKIFGHACTGLLDSGASVTVKQACPLIERQKNKLKPSDVVLRAANSGFINVLGTMTIPFEYKNRIINVSTIIVDSLAPNLILGVDFWRAAGIRIIDHEAEEVSAVKSPSSMEVRTEIVLETTERLALEKAIDEYTISRDGTIGRTNVLEHKIELIEGATPFLQRSHLFSPALQDKINAELDDMLQKNIVQPSKSPVASPLVPVTKPNGSVRICLDSRKLNLITKKDQFPVPNLNHIFARMPKAKYFSTIDLSKAFWQVPLSKDPIANQFATSRELTAFIVPGRGLFEFCVMPFGLVNSAASQCRLMYKVLGHDLEPRCFVYIDDIIIMTETVLEMIKLIGEVGRRLTKAQLSINIDKLNLFARQVKYLGYIISEQGMEIDPDRVKVMMEYPKPKNLKSLRRFLGLTGYYRRLIKNFSGIASPLTNLLRRNTTNKLMWTDGALESFDLLKTAMCEAPVVANPDFTFEFHIQCDASDTAGAAALGQMLEDREVVISYFSHKWSTTEAKWGATEREAATVLYAIRHFKSYLWGRHFTIITDAQALTHVKTLKTDGSSKLARWALELNSHDVTIKHRSGKLSVVPDALSRAVEAIMAIQPSTGDAWYDAMVARMSANPETHTDFRLLGSRLLKYEPSKNDIGCFDYVWKEYVPETQRTDVITSTHQVLCHLGWEKCAEFMRRRYFWPKMVSTIESVVRRCDTCRASKAPNRNTRVPMGQSRNASYPFQMVAIDHWGPTTRSRRGNTCILIVLDVFSKMVLLHPKRDTSSGAVVQFLEEEVFLKYGTPQTLLSDNHKPLIGRNMIQLLNKYGVKHWTIPAYHSQANPAERYLRTVSAAIRAQVSERNNDHRTWDEDLPMIQLALNSTINETTRMTPFFINFGREPILHGQEHDLVVNQVPRSNLSTTQLRQKFDRIRERVTANVQIAQEKFRHQYNKKTQPLKFDVNERVWRRNRELSNATQHFSQRLAPKYIPCRVIDQMGNDTYKVRDEEGIAWHRVHANDLLKD